MAGEQKTTAPTRRPVKKRPATHGRLSQAGRRAPSANRSQPKRSDRKKGFFSSLSCCSTKKKTARKPAQKQPMSVKKQYQTRSASKQKPQPRLLRQKSKSSKSRSKSREKSREKIGMVTAKEEPKKAATPKTPKKGSKELVVECKKKEDEAKQEKEKDAIATAIAIDDDSYSDDQQAKKKGAWAVAVAGPEQSLLVKKFIRDGRNVLRWEYEESAPVYSKEPLGIPRLLEDKPKRIANVERPLEKQEIQESKKSQEALQSETKKAIPTKQRCCSCCNCEGNKKLRRS